MSLLQQIVVMGAKPQGVATDSRHVGPGDLFLAYPGESGDGRRHIGEAIAKGACGVLWEQGDAIWKSEWQLPNLPVSDLREQASGIAGEFYGEPSKNLWMIGITGTNGKTSCSHWLAACLGRLGNRTAVVGTLGNGFAGSLNESANTTPDAVLLQKQLAAYAEEGADAVAMEVSSHGLAQGRVNGLKFDVAMLTNLSRDHLDYHGSMEAYADAKARLFGWPTLKCAVLNADDDFGERVALALHKQGKKILTYGIDAGSVSCTALNFSEHGFSMEVMTPWGAAEISVPVLGRFNVSNVLAVLATLLASDIPLNKAIDALQSIRPVPGRMQQLGGGRAPLVVVDYAHTPDALAKVLTSLREQTQGRLICVFGCGGNRDKGKRPLMGEVASSLADWVLVTSDNPRNEDPQAIIDEIVAGMSGVYDIEADRAVAISRAIREAQAGDVVLVAGKGHEDYQQIGERKLPFSDSATAADVLQEVAA